MADAPPSHRIQLSCPECGHRQLEPGLVVSTQCRSCRCHFDVVDGRAVSRMRPTARLASPEQLAAISAPRPPAVSAPPAVLRRPEPRRSPAWLNFLLRRKPPRQVPCFECGANCSAVSDAQSTQCPRCGSYLSLRDYEIAGPWNEPIRTRGNVRIHKGGSVRGVAIRCHHLLVLGELGGAAECSGDLVIRSDGRVGGEVHCQRLRVERGAKVEFLHPVTTRSASIRGRVRGQITCFGPLVLERRSTLHGLARTPALQLRPGARHTGTIDRLPSPLS